MAYLVYALVKPEKF
nr:potassium-transporting ATPase subunit F [Frigoribacterium sp. VKM Ac-1396]